MNAALKKNWERQYGLFKGNQRLPIFNKKPFVEKYFVYCGYEGYMKDYNYSTYNLIIFFEFKIH